jgi:hypothetical protein
MKIFLNLNRRTGHGLGALLMALIVGAGAAAPLQGKELLAGRTTVVFGLTSR